MVSSFLSKGGRLDHSAGVGQPSPSSGLVFASCGRQATSHVSPQLEILFRKSVLRSLGIIPAAVATQEAGLNLNDLTRSSAKKILLLIKEIIFNTSLIVEL